MKLIVGLGNPGEEYKITRHNLGFEVILELKNKIAEDQRFKLDRKFNAEIINTQYKNEKLILAMPQTYMNKSGEAIKKIADFYKISASNILIIYDDLDLPFGTIKIGKFQSSAGHKGVQSAIDQLKTTDFDRMRIGIGSSCDKNIPAEIYVLQKFNQDEQELLPEIIDKAIKMVIESIINNKNNF